MDYLTVALLMVLGLNCCVPTFEKQTPTQLIFRQSFPETELLKPRIKSENRIVEENLELAKRALGRARQKEIENEYGSP